MYFAFRTPDGEEITVDVEQHLKTAMMDKSDDYWSIGSGDAAILGGSQFSPVQLWIIFDGYDHFQLQFVGPGQLPRIAHNTDGTMTAATVKVSGDAINLASQTLFPREKALEIALYFCKTLRPDPRYVWA